MISRFDLEKVMRFYFKDLRESRRFSVLWPNLPGTSTYCFYTKLRTPETSSTIKFYNFLHEVI